MENKQHYDDFDVARALVAAAMFLFFFLLFCYLFVSFVVGLLVPGCYCYKVKLIKKLYGGGASAWQMRTAEKN